MKIRIAPEIVRKIPGIQVGVVVLKGLENRKKKSVVSQLMRGVFAQKQSELKNEEKMKAITHLLQQMRLGKNEDELFPEVQLMESNLRRANRGKAPDHKDNLYALAHYLSLKFMVPLFAMDMDELEKDVVIAPIKPKKGKRPEDMVFTPATKNVVLWCLDMGMGSREEFLKLPNILAENMEKYCGGKKDIAFVLNAENTEMDMGYESEKEGKFLAEEAQKSKLKAPPATQKAEVKSEDKNAQEPSAIAEPAFLTQPQASAKNPEEKLLKDLLAQQVQHSIAAFLQEKGHEQVPQVTLETPADPTHGDYSTSIAMKLSKELGMAPQELAKEIMASIPRPEYVEKMEIAGPGFINFSLTESFLRSELENVLKYAGNYGRSAQGKGKTVIIEYSAPNIAKPLGIHHLLSTVIGQTISNICRFSGYHVISLNYWGDWGTQFGKLLYAYKTWGNEEVVKKDPLNELLKLYVKFHDEAEQDLAMDDKGRAEFKKLEEHDEENTKLWKWFRDLSIYEVERIYQKLDVHFDEVLGESLYLEGAKKILEEGKQKNIFSTGEKGAVVVQFPEEKYPPYVVQKGDGTTLYSTRDLASMRDRVARWSPAKLLYVVDVAQKLHFQQLFETAGMFGLAPGVELTHVIFGRMNMPEGRMSTRKGEVILLDEVIKEATSRAEKIVEEKSRELTPEERVKIAQGMAVSALKYNVISQNRETNIQFDWDRMLSLEGNSAPYLEYAYARAKSILRKSEEASTEKSEPKKSLVKPVALQSVSEKQTSLFSMETEPASGENPQSSENPHSNDDASAVPFGHATEQTLLRLLRRFPEVVVDAAEQYKPSTLSTYLFELARAFSGFYNSVHVLGTEKKELRQSRLHLVKAVAQVLENGMKVLGISTFERM